MRQKLSQTSYYSASSSERFYLPNGTFPCNNLGLNTKSSLHFGTESPSDGQEQEKSGNDLPRLRRDRGLQLLLETKAGWREASGQQVLPPTPKAHRACRKEEVGSRSFEGSISGLPPKIHDGSRSVDDAAVA